MADIVHKIQISKPKEDVYSAVATVDGLKGWWTTNVDGESKEGSNLTFKFPEEGPGFEVMELYEPEFVKWRCVDGPDDWKDTFVTFELEEKDGGTELLFGHSAWEDQNDFFAHCNTKWATFMLSLKSFCEKSAGSPFPDDIKIEG